MAEILRNLKDLERRRRRRDVREIVVAAGASGVIASALWWLAEAPWIALWVLVLAAGAVAIAVWRAIALLRRWDRSCDQSVEEFCRAERRSLERQIRLMRSLPWWYLAPVLVGTNLAVFLTTRRPAAVMAIVFPLTIIVVAAAFWLNRRTLRHEMLPMRAELDRCLAGLRDEADS